MAISSDPTKEANDSTTTDAAVAKQALDTSERSKGNSRAAMEVSARSTSKRFMETSERRKGNGTAMDVSDRSTSKKFMESSDRNTSKNAMDTSDRRKKRLSDMSERSIQLPTASQVSDDSFGNLFATKDNSAFKWQRARGVIGCLEVPSEPTFRFQDPLVPHRVRGRDEIFDEALQAWKDLKLRDDFVKACEKLPSEMCCCGLLSDQDATKRRFVYLLNEGWCKRTNKKLLHNKSGLKVDTFLWNWQNASGKSESNILLIRFIQTSSYRFNQANDEGSVDFELLDMEEDACEEDSDEGEPTLDSFSPTRAKMER